MSMLLPLPIWSDGVHLVEADEAARRWRMLQGLWATDLNNKLADEMNPRRVIAIGDGDVTKNGFRSLVTQLAVLYIKHPALINPVEGSVQDMTAFVDAGGLWELASFRLQLDIGLRETWFSVDVVEDSDGKPKLLAEAIPRHLWQAEAHPDSPDEPHTIEIMRSVRVPETDTVGWARFIYSIKDLENPTFDVVNEKGESIMADLGMTTGWREHWRRADGVPFLPGELYHARRTGKLTDSMYGIEFVEGSLIVALLWTLWRNAVRDASWPQRWSLGAFAAGADVDRDHGIATVPTDPSSILVFEGIGGETKPQLGQWAAGADPESLGNAIRDYAADLASDFDRNPADIKREHTSARSGYSIEVSRDGMRAAMTRYMPGARRGDVSILSKIAAMRNRRGGDKLPEEGWDLRYVGLPLSSQERKQRLEEYKLMSEAGVGSKIRLLSLLEETSEEVAAERLEEIKETQDQARLTPEMLKLSVEIARDVASGAMPPDAGFTILELIGISPDLAKKVAEEPPEPEPVPLALLEAQNTPENPFEPGKSPKEAPESEKPPKDAK